MTSGNEQLKGQLEQFALELGFDRCRIAIFDRPKHGEAFKQWLGEGAAGEMRYMERGAEKRLDPALVQRLVVSPGLRTVRRRRRVVRSSSVTSSTMDVETAGGTSSP